MGLKANQTHEGERLDLGTLVTTLILAAAVAGAGAIVSVAVLVNRANASDVDVASINKQVRAMELNQVRIGEVVRRLERSSDWSQSKLDALLQAVNVPVPERPALPPSPVVLRDAP